MYDILNPGSTSDIEAMLESISGTDLSGLISNLERAIGLISQLDINPSIKAGTVEELNKYLDIITRINDVERNRWDREDSSVNGTGGKLEQFLGRYKYSLLLIGGALTGIMGMMRYSNTFGTALDVIGQAVGYLADVILFPLLPAIMLFSDFIVGLADYISGLPGPVQLLISSLVVLGAAFLLIKRIASSDLFAGLLGGLKKVIAGLLEAVPLTTAAGALTAAGWIAGNTSGLLIGFAAVYALIQLGVLNMIANFGKNLQQEQPTLMALISAWLGPLGLIGIPIIDFVTGQWDKIPMHMDMASKIISESWNVLALNVLKSINDMAIGIQGFIGSIGELLQKNALTEGMGKSMSEWAASQQGKFGDDSDAIQKEIDRRNNLIEQYRRIISTGTNIEDQTPEFNPGSIFRGLTSEDQKKYYEDLQKMQEDIGMKSVDDILAPYKNIPTLQDTYNQVATDLQKSDMASLVQQSPPVLPSSEAPVSAKGAGGAPVYQTITNDVDAAITIQGYNKDVKQLVRELGPELMKWMDQQSRGSRV